MVRKLGFLQEKLAEESEGVSALAMRYIILFKSLPPPYILRNAVIWMVFMALIEICDDQPEDHKLFKKVNELGVVM